MIGDKNNLIREVDHIRSDTTSFDNLTKVDKEVDGVFKNQQKSKEDKFKPDPIKDKKTEPMNLKDINPDMSEKGLKNVKTAKKIAAIALVTFGVMAVVGLPLIITGAGVPLILIGAIGAVGSLAALGYLGEEEAKGGKTTPPVPPSQSTSESNPVSLATKKLEEAQKKSASCQAAYESCKIAYKKAEEEMEQASSEDKEKAVQKMVLQGKKLSHADEAYSEAMSEEEKALDELKNAKDEQKKAIDEQKNASDESTENKKELETNKKDKNLETDLTKKIAEEKNEQLNNLKVESPELKEANDALQKCDGQIKIIEQKITDLNKKIQDKEDELDKAKSTGKATGEIQLSLTDYNIELDELTKVKTENENNLQKMQKKIEVVKKSPVYKAQEEFAILKLKLETIKNSESTKKIEEKVTETKPTKPEEENDIEKQKNYREALIKKNENDKKISELEKQIKDAEKNIEKVRKNQEKELKNQQKNESKQLEKVKNEIKELEKGNEGGLLGKINNLF